MRGKKSRRRTAIRISAFEWDDKNTHHAKRHGLTPSIAEQVRSRKPLFFLNKPFRVGSHRMIGPDKNGRHWTVIVIHSGKPQEPELWRVIAGWPSNGTETHRYLTAIAAGSRRRGK